MKKMLKLTAAVFTAVFALSGMTAFAQSSEPTAKPTTVPNETIIYDNKTLTPNGNAQLLDNVTDNENLQFITVTAKDGNVFYIVIDKGTSSENVYFLNTVDDSDLSALVNDYTPKTEASTATEKPATENNKTETDEKKPVAEKQSNNTFLIILLVLIGAVGVGTYYFKVILPKKKLQQADDIEDFDFMDGEEIINEDENLEDTENE